MLRVRNEQMKVFEQEAVRDFEDRLVERLREWFPKKYEYLGRPGSRAVVSHGLKSARRHELTDKYSLSVYVTLVFLLGSDFDTDPQFPWAAEILDDVELTDETLRVASLYRKAGDYLAKTTGPDGQFIDRALGRVESVMTENVTESPGSAEFYRRVIGLFENLFQEKLGYVGELGTRRLIQQGMESAKTYGITGPRGVALYAGLMFMLGSGFATDPQFPWAGAALTESGEADEAQKVERLYDAAMNYLSEWLSEGPAAHPPSLKAGE